MFGNYAQAPEDGEIPDYEAMYKTVRGELHVAYEQIGELKRAKSRLIEELHQMQREKRHGPTQLPNCQTTPETFKPPMDLWDTWGEQDEHIEGNENLETDPDPEFVDISEDESIPECCRVQPRGQQSDPTMYEISPPVEVPSSSPSPSPDMTCTDLLRMFRDEVLDAAMEDTMVTSMKSFFTTRKDLQWPYLPNSVVPEFKAFLLQQRSIPAAIILL